MQKCSDQLGPYEDRTPMSCAVNMEFPINMSKEKADLYCEEVANKIAAEIRRHVREKLGPVWHICSDGWRTGRDFIHEPGVYRCEVLFTVNAKKIF